MIDCRRLHSELVRGYYQANIRNYTSGSIAAARGRNWVGDRACVLTPEPATMVSDVNETI